MRITHVSVLVSTLAALCAANVHAQVPFSLDTSFRTIITEQNVNYVQPLSTGDILLSGQIRFPGDVATRLLAKVDHDGDQVASFPYSYGGTRITPWNNQYYVGGTLVRRVNFDGSLDPSFIFMNSGPYFLSLQGGDYHVYPDGRILMSGTHTLSDTIRGFVGNYDLIWFSNEGYLDTTATHRKGNGVVYAMKELPNGQFVCTSTCTQFEGKAVDWIFKFNADGTPDTTFRTEVIEGQARDFLGLVDGRIHAAGRFRRATSPTDTLVLARFMPDGSLDPAFATPDFVDVTIGYPVAPFVSHLQSLGSGKLLVTGQFQFVNGEPRNGICLLDSTGALLPEFDGCGVGQYSYGGFDYVLVTSAYVDSTNGYMYICGAYNGYNDGTINDLSQRFVSRLFLGSPSTASAQAAESTTGMRVYPNPTSGSVTVEVATSGPQAVCTLRDALGRACAAEPLIAGRAILDVSTLAPGLYHLHVVQAGAWVTGRKLVVE